MRQRAGIRAPERLHGYLLTYTTAYAAPHRTIIPFTRPLCKLFPLGRLAVDGLIVVSERLCAEGPGVHTELPSDAV